MATFYRTSVYLCLSIIVFTLAINFVNSLQAFDPYESGMTDVNEENALEKISGLSGGMVNIWAVALTLTGGAAIALAWVTKQITPIGIYLFSVVFWTSWIRMWTVTDIGGYIPGEFTILFFVGAIFIFIAAVVGMLTGSG